MRSFWKNTKAAIVGTVFILNAIMIVMWVLVACQPKTVVVERVDGTLVPVEEVIPSPIMVIDPHQTVNIGSYRYDVYKLVDIREHEICRVLQNSSYIATSCRAMTPAELEEWQ